MFGPQVLDKRRRRKRAAPRRARIHFIAGAAVGRWQNGGHGLPDILRRKAIVVPVCTPRAPLRDGKKEKLAVR